MSHCRPRVSSQINIFCGNLLLIIYDFSITVLKWNFTTPREEFFELLKEQMATAGLNKQLVANMFHNDFR